MKKVMVFLWALCLLLGCCGCFRVEEQPEQTKPTPPPPVKPTAQHIPDETHPLASAYKEQPDAYVAFTQTHQQPREVYVPMEEIMAYQTQYPDCNGTWFRDQLEGDELCIYNCYLYALEHCYLNFSVYVEDNDRDFTYIREAVSMDTPLIEQNVNQYGEWTHSWATNYWGEQMFITAEQFSVDRWEMRMEALEQCRRIVAEIPAECETQLQKMEYLYRYVCDHVEYVAYESMKDEDYLYDAVIKGQTVCDGYSNMLMLLFRLIGVECCEAAGYDVDVSSDEVYEDAGGHTWVVAKVDGQWYNFDATFEDTKGDDLEWDTMYFGFSDRRLSKKFLDCENIRPKCTDLSRDYPFADLAVSNITQGSQVKKIVRLAESGMAEGKTKLVIGLHEKPDQKDYDIFFDKYENYVTEAHYVEVSSMEIGGCNLLFLTVNKE